MFSVSIDRIGVIMPVPAKELYCDYINLLWGMVNEPGCKVWKNDKKCYTSAKVPLGGGQTLRLRLGISHHNGYLKFDFNPASLSGIHWEQLSMYLSFMLPFGYASLYQQGKVSYLEPVMNLR